jgi:dethiobiotin synthetase
MTPVPQAFLITGTDTGVGKTTIGCALAFALRARGLRTGVMKPAETGCTQGQEGLVAGDALALASAASSPLPLDLICPYRYRSPLAPAAAAETDGLPPPDLGRIAECFRLIAAQSDVVLVEGAGGLTVPLTWNANFADLARMLALEVILVVANRLGCLNAAVLSLEYARHKQLRVRGYILNDAEPANSIAAQTNAASLRRLTAIASLGSVRYREPLPPAIVDQVLAPLAVGI